MIRAALLSLLLISPVFADDWKPAPGPLMTRWAKDVSPTKVHSEYPRPQMVRKEWENLNGLWDFETGAAKPESWSQKILVPFPVESSLSGVGKMVDGPVWYRRTFAIPEKWKWKGNRILLHFGAVNWESAVWINGKQVGTHKGGYDGFTFDITEQLKPGDNEIIVKAINPADNGMQPRGKQVKKPGGIFYTLSTGIWQTVWLEPVTKYHFKSIQVTTDCASGRIKVLALGDNNGLKNTVKIYVVAGDEDIGTKFGELNKPIEFVVPKPKLWTPADPFLYELTVKLECDDPSTGTDSVESYFAFRKIEIGKDENGVTRILLNGKPYFQVGPLDQGFWPDGLYTAPTDEALKYDIEITKKLGFNMIRKHVKVEPDRWYYWCDKLGMLVWQDMPSGDKFIGPRDPDIKRSPESAKQYETGLKAMIDGRRNHPCIVMWVPFNEGWGQFDTQRITEWIKKYDPTRLVNCASGWADRGVGDVHDWHVYPGPGSPKPEANRAAVLGEFGGLGLPTEGHMWTSKHWGYVGVRNSADLTRRYERLLQRVYELKKNPGLSAAVYTQTTDVETEANGLLTYDRAVIKVDLDRVAAANRGDFSKVPKVKTVVPTSQKKGIEWHYRFDKPPEAWKQAAFADFRWKKGEAGFGTKGTPGAVVRTEWKTPDIWLRREFELPEGKFDNLHLLIHHDEDAEVYLNGVLAASVKGYVTSYEIESISSEAIKALKVGKNTIAVHCHQTGGGQYIDMGLVKLEK